MLGLFSGVPAADLIRICQKRLQATFGGGGEVRPSISSDGIVEIGLGKTLKQGAARGCQVSAFAASAFT